MTILAVIQSCAGQGIPIARPTAVYGSTDRELVEIAEMANEMAATIASEHDWQVLKRAHAITGNGETQSFALQDDYDRMPWGQEIWSSRFSAPLCHVIDHNDWLALDVRNYALAVSSWTIIGGEWSFYPVLTDGEVAQFYYVSNLIVTDADDELKTSFTADTDTFRLPERVLKLGLIWKWRAKKGLPHETELGDYLEAKTKAIARDKGARGISVGFRGYRDAKIAYPQTISPAS